MNKPKQRPLILRKGEVSAAPVFFDPSHLKKLLTYIIPLGPDSSVNIQNLVSDSTQISFKKQGFWLVRASSPHATDEYGWAAIHWPLLLHRMAWSAETSNYLKATGHNVRTLQTTPIHELEQASNQLSVLRAGLLQTLPPGCLLEADNSFFRQLVGTCVPPNDQLLFENSPIEAFTSPWSVFRFAPFARTREKSAEAVLSKYSPVSELSIGKVHPEVLSQCPDLIKVLLKAFSKACMSQGKGWQHWGLAWTKAGLVFNYQLALLSLQNDEAECHRLCPTGIIETMARWASPDYGTQKSTLRGIPPIGAITRKDISAHSYMAAATEPYYALFQDTDADIQARAVYHGSDFKFLFPIRPDTRETILTYMDQLLTLSANKYASDASIYEVDSVKRLSKKEVSASERNSLIYPVRFNAYNLGSALPPPSVHASVRPFDLAMIEFKGEKYFSYPTSLATLLPELHDRQFYDNRPYDHFMHWRMDNANKWTGRFLSAKERQTLGKVENVVAITFNQLATDLPLIRVVKGQPFFHTLVFGAEGHAWTLLENIKAFRPEVAQLHELNDHINVFRNFWDWIYKPQEGLKQGKYSEEFVYPLGFETKHCPVNKRLDSSLKRFQFVVDKALHSLDANVAYMLEEQLDRTSPRSARTNSYDDFIFWYVAHHEIGLLPWSLDAKEQATYITKRWMPWRRVPSATRYLVDPYGIRPKKYDRPDLEKVFAYATEHFGAPYTQY